MALAAPSEATAERGLNKAGEKMKARRRKWLTPTLAESLEGESAHNPSLARRGKDTGQLRSEALKRSLKSRMDGLWRRGF